MDCENCTGVDSNSCRNLGYCAEKLFVVFSEGDLTYSTIVSAVRRDIYELTANENVKPSGVRSWLYDQLWITTAQPVDEKMRPVDIEMDCFEPSDDDIDNDRAQIFDERLREFFRGNACAAPRNVEHAYVTQKWHIHFMTMANVVGTAHPERSRCWPRVIKGKYVDPRVANDNRPPALQD